MVSWPLSRPTITPHLIPLISAFIKSWRERRGWKGGDESGRESASLIKAKQAANRCPPRIFAQEIITPPSLCIILSRTGFARASRRTEGRIRACWIHESHHRCSLQIHPFALLCKITEEEGTEWKFTLRLASLRGRKFLFDILEKIRLETRIFKNIIFLRYLATLWLSTWYIVFFFIFRIDRIDRLEYFEYFY